MNCGSKFASAFGIAVSVLALSAPAAAKPVTFVFTGTATGDLGGQAFTDAKFTITTVSDTDLAHTDRRSDIFFDNFETKLELAGMQAVSLLGPTVTFVNNDFDTVGIFDTRPGVPNIFTIRPSGDIFWDLESNFSTDGPGLVPTMVGSFGIATSGGLLRFQFGRDIPGHFEAIVDTPPVSPPVGDVPEPAALGLLGLGLVGLGAMRRRRAA